MGADVGERAMGKAQNNSLKYALRQAFLQATGEDPDDTASEELIFEYPSASMSETEKGAWENRVRQEMNNGLSFKDATVKADEAFYNYKGVNNG
jgi:hypothetical protein